MGRAAIAAALLLAPIGLAPQQPVFRAGAQTVAVYATVRDAAGRLVPGLTRSDFQVLDDGRPASITTFSNDILPAQIALLLDMSTSMLGEHARVRESALRFVDALLPDDRVRIGTFGDEIALSPWLTSDKGRLGRVLREEVWPGGDTPLWSAMRAGMESLGDVTPRRVIVMLTDGIDTGCPRLIGAASSTHKNRVVRTQQRRRPDFGSASSVDETLLVRTRARPRPRSRRASVAGIVDEHRTTPGSVARRVPALDDVRQSWTTPVSRGRRASAPDDVRQFPCAGYDDVERLALEREFLVYAIGMEGPGLAGGLIKLADDTGGGHFELKRNEDLAAAFREVLDELHHQYALGFTPVALDGRTHLLEVRLLRHGLSARARKSYLAVAR